MATQPTGKAARAEAVLLGLAAASPLFVFARRLASEGVPRFAIDGDYALVEVATRMVVSGKTLLGPYSRFLFNHPGPLYFYVIAPVYWLCGKMPVGIFAGALFVHALSIVVTVAGVRLASSRAHGVATSLVVLAWVAAFGAVCFQPWNPLVVVTPLIAYFVLAALAMRGATAALPWCAFFGLFAAETHVSTVPVVAVTALLVAATTLGRHRREPLGKRPRKHLAALAAVVAIAVAPPLVEQATAATGNLTKLARFFAQRSEPPVPWGRVFLQWLQATAWLPDRVLSTTLRTEGPPIVLYSDPILEHATPTSVTIAIVWLLAAGVTLGIARARRDTLALLVTATGLLASAISLLALRQVAGVTYDYLVFWTTAPTTTVWIGVALCVGGVAADLAARAHALRRLRAAAFAPVVLGALLTTSLLATWSSRNRLVGEPNASVAGAYQGLRDRVRATGETPVLHREMIWNIATVLLDELVRDGLPVAVVERDRWLLGRQFPTEHEVARPLHIYTQHYAAVLPTAACLDLVATSNPLELRGAANDVITCDAPKPTP